jgi:hypothetical protein
MSWKRFFRSNIIKIALGYCQIIVPLSHCLAKIHRGNSLNSDELVAPQENVASWNYLVANILICYLFNNVFRLRGPVL